MSVQAVRLLDVFVIGPLMVYVATVGTTAPRWARVALGIFGVTTMGYNGVRYLRGAL